MAMSKEERAEYERALRTYYARAVRRGVSVEDASALIVGQGLASARERIDQHEDAGHHQGARVAMDVLSDAFWRERVPRFASG